MSSFKKKLFSKAITAAKLIFNYKVPGRYLEIRQDDIFLVSYPKSGNTWMRFLLGNILAKDGVDFKNVNDVIPDIHKSTKKQIEALSSPRIIKSHSPYNKRYPRVIYIYRDPRDVLISYYYWYKKLGRSKYKSFDNFFSSFLVGDVGFGLWSVHFNNWILAAEENPDKVLLIKYEDLKSNTSLELKRALNFCNITFTDGQVDNAVRMSDFETMKRVEERQSDEPFFHNTNKEIKFVRSGGSEWGDRFSKNQEKEFNGVFGDILDKYFS